MPPCLSQYFTPTPSTIPVYQTYTPAIMNLFSPLQTTSKNGHTRTTTKAETTGACSATVKYQCYCACITRKQRRSSRLVAATVAAHYQTEIPGPYYARVHRGTKRNSNSSCFGESHHGLSQTQAYIAQYLQVVHNTASQ